MARQLRIGNKLTCPGINGFSSFGAIRERVNDSYLRFPSIVRHFFPVRVHSSITELMGASLQTLQHHLKSLAGGPKLGRFSQKASFTFTSMSSILFFVQKFLANSTVSGNSMPVFAKNIFIGFLMALRVRSSVVRLYFPPEKDTWTGVSAKSFWLAIPFIVFTASLTSLFMWG